MSRASLSSRGGAGKEGAPPGSAGGPPPVAAPIPGSTPAAAASTTAASATSTSTASPPAKPATPFERTGSSGGNGSGNGTSGRSTSSDEFAQHLYAENVQLRQQLNQLQRELFNQSMNIDALEEEVRELKKTSREGLTTAKSLENSQQRSGTAGGISELDETRSALERKTNEWRQCKEDLAKEHDMVMRQKEEIALLQKEMAELREDLQILRHKKQGRRATLQANAPVDAQATLGEDAIDAAEVIALRNRLADATANASKHRNELLHIVNESNRRHSQQQNQIQGMEMMLDSIRREYEEFFDIISTEHAVYRKQQQEHTEKLRSDFEHYKQSQFDEKRRIVVDYQNLLYSMQNQFEEYRTISEYLFNGEIAKIEDELATITLRYEQECLYIMQAKDKFYTDLMIAKDAKIMHLVEGSDLQVIFHRHELDIENLRKEHAKEVERVKTDYESEQKNLVTLLQRQNASLESKSEKLHQHVKSLENKIRELTTQVDQKIRLLEEKEEARVKTESAYEKKRTEMEDKIRSITQEKEHLRHKVIRLNFSARGEGADSVENIVKRIGREQKDLSKQYEELTEKYGSIVKTQDALSKKLREKEKLTTFLDKEITRRNSELEAMTRTFEIFLQGRTKQMNADHKQHLKDLVNRHNALARPVFKDGSRLQLNSRGQGVEVPDKKAQQAKNQMTELERGYAYLRRFKTLSRAFVSGDYRKLQLPKNVGAIAGVTGPWQNTPLYTKLEESSQEMARIYGMGTVQQTLDKTPGLYIPAKLSTAVATVQDGSVAAAQNPVEVTPALKLYGEEVETAAVEEASKNNLFLVNGANALEGETIAQ